MREAEREDRAGLPGSLLSAGELSARRRRARRRRARRRTGVAAVLAIGVAVLAAVGLAGSGSRERRMAGARVFVASRPSAGVLAGRLPAGPRQRAVGEARAVDRVLAYTSYVRLAGRRRPDVALTFDDGPSSYTPAILAILRRTHAAATFFVIGRWARVHPQLVADEAGDGFEIGDHTETHPMLSLLSPAAQPAEIGEAADAIRSAGAPRPRLFRPPYGSFSQTTLAILRGERMLMVLWTADTKDYSRPGVARIVYTAVSGGQPGAIILMHDGGGDRSQTVAALPRIIGRLRQRGFRLVTISQLISDDPPLANQPPPHPLSGRF